MRLTREIVVAEPGLYIRENTNGTYSVYGLRGDATSERYALSDHDTLIEAEAWANGYRCGSDENR